MEDVFGLVVFHCSFEVSEGVKAYSQYLGVLKFVRYRSALFVEEPCLAF